MQGESDFSAKSLAELFQRNATERPDAVALRTPGGAVEITWREYAQRAGRMAAALAALRVRRGDTIALMLTNRPEFNIADTGALLLGATPFSIYNTLAPEQIAYLLRNAGSRVVICESQYAEGIEQARQGTAVEWGEKMAAAGENRWPPVGRNRWPLTNDQSGTASRAT